MTKQLIIITGGAGFIGSCLLSALNSRQEDNILIVDSLGTSDKWNNLSNKRFSDYQDKNSFIEKIRTGHFNSTPVKAIFHMGACSRTTEKNVDYLIHNNTLFTRDLAQFAIGTGVPLYYASSAATYGQGDDGYEDDESRLFTLKPSNAYGFSKHLFDTWAFSKGWLNKITGFKFFNVYGPNEGHKTGMTSIVWNAFHQIRETGTVKLFKSDRPEYRDGEQKRDFVYVKDVTSVMLWFYDNPGYKGIYNIGSGTANTWNYIAECIFGAMGLNPEITYTAMPEMLKGKYQYYTCSSVNKLRAVCDVKFTPLRDAVHDYVNNYLLKGRTL